MLLALSIGVCVVMAGFVVNDVIVMQLMMVGIGLCLLLLPSPRLLCFGLFMFGLVVLCWMCVILGACVVIVLIVILGVRVCIVVIGVFPVLLLFVMFWFLGCVCVARAVVVVLCLCLLYKL